MLTNILTSLVIMPSSSDQISKVELHELISILILVSRIKVLIQPFTNYQKGFYPLKVA